MDINASKDFIVTELGWERIFLNFTIQANYEGEIKFQLRRFNRKVKVKRTATELKKEINLISRETIDIDYDKKEGNFYTFSLNLAAVKGRSFINNGKWHILAVTDEERHICSVAPAVAYKADENCRIFDYYGGKYSYNITFSHYTEDEENLTFVLGSSFMIMNNKWYKRKYVKEARTIPGKFQRGYMAAVIVLIKLYYQIAEHLSPKHGKKILFMSETKNYLWGNLLYIDKRLKERGLDKEFKITYSCRQAVGQHKSAFSWLKVVTNIARQDYIFIDDYAPIFGFLSLNKRTKLIQVWHAGEGFKAVGYCRFGKAGSPFPVGSCHKKYDYALTGSKKLVKVFEEVFGIEKDAFLPVGMARLDGFLDPDKISSFRKEFYEEYPQFQNKKIILFAPTFRGTDQKTAYYDYSQLDLEQLYDFCGDEYVFLIKMHPFVVEAIDIPEKYKDRLYDFSKYPTINDLYYVTELLITDYSSNYFEYALMEKPVLFFTYDRELYELTRGVHRSVKDSAPGKVCDTFEEMMTALKNKDFEEAKIHQFVKDNFGEYDGHASDRVIDQILLKKEN